MQNPGGLFSNDFIFHVAKDESIANALLHKDLSEILRESKFDRLIGTWVDEGTNGKAFKTTFAWKIKDRVLEVTSTDPGNESVSLMGVNPETGEVFHMGGDRSGSMFTGKWDLSGDSDAILEVSYVNTDAQKGVVKIRYHLRKDDRLEVSLGSAPSSSLKLVRAKK